MKYTKGSMTNALEAIAEARKQLDALPQNTLVIITKTVKDDANPTYDVYVTLGGLHNGKIIES